MNSISPGWIDTDFTVYEGSDAIQHPAGRVGNPYDISNMVVCKAYDLPWRKWMETGIKGKTRKGLQS